ncbi:glutathione S-transferase family protein [Aquirhabdus parva]|uniref:Glutathione S-transferase family protein n=1 Tax=Aquirhabdus parva TaxID=2283318 RepID=A0A345P4X8_9GAMM|nr:glutathione S-transferase family protein [Aquirhabdus parva]AXI02337.1 glutathione S-transferase family protein [Aquirhabdus parva]
MRTLYQFPLSHYCEKARWLLDYKELDYVARNMIPGPHRLSTRWHASSDTLPMLHDDNVWIADSSEIALYLDGVYAEKPLISSDPKERTSTIKLDKKATELGYHVRRWMFLYLLEEPHTIDIVIGEKGLMRTFRPISAFMLKQGMRQLYKINPEKAEQSKQKLSQLINEIEAALLANGADGKQGYLVGKTFSLADIAVCAMAAPIFGPVGTPWVPPSHIIPPEPLAVYQAELLARPFGQYVTRIYAHERKARVDWRGQ